VITGTVQGGHEAFDVGPALTEIARDRHIGLAESEQDFRTRVRDYLTRTRPDHSTGSPTTSPRSPGPATPPPACAWRSPPPHCAYSPSSPTPSPTSPAHPNCAPPSTEPPHAPDGPPAPSPPEPTGK
jgi:hypothetical protein